MLTAMASDLSAVAGDECVCRCHRDSSIRHVAACCAHCAGCDTRVRAAVLTTHQPDHCVGFRAGRKALFADAVVCLLAGVAWIVLGFTHALMPTVGHGAIGLLLMLWGVFLWLGPGRLPLRGVLALVTLVNAIALVAAIVGAILVSGTALTTILAVSAAVVAVFTLWEWLALHQTQA